MKDFESTTWASSNRDSFFFKSDTVKLIKIGDKSSSASEKDAAGYFGNHDFVTMDFKQNHELHLFLTKVDPWSIVTKEGKYLWSFDEKDRVLKLFYNNKLFATLVVVDQKEVELKSNYVDRSAKKTMEITLHKVR